MFLGRGKVNCMTLDFGTFLRLFGETLRDPAGIAQKINRLRLPHQVGWMGLSAVTALTVVVVYLESFLPGLGDIGFGIGGRPFIDAVFLGAMTVILIFVLYYAGRAMGGTGTFGATLLMMTWFQAVVFVLISIQLISTLIAPGVSAFVALIALGLQMYCLIHFLNVLHDFKSLPKAAGLFFASVFGLVLGLAFILTLIGGASLVGSA